MAVYTTKKISSLHIETPLGLLVLSPKTGEDPEIKMFVDTIEDADDGMTNDGQLIINSVKSRTYIQNVYAFRDEDVPYLESIVNAAILGTGGEVPANFIMTDSSIYSNTGTFVGDLNYNGTGTIELKFASAKNFILSN